jgi:hypothetical protein
MEILINDGIGGYGLSRHAVVEYYKLKNKKVFIYKNTYNDDIKEKNEFKRIEEEDTKTDYGWYNVLTKDFGKILIANDDFYKSMIYPDNPITIRKKDLIERDDKDLIKVVKKLGKKAGGEHCELKIVTIPDDVDWEIFENDMGVEWVAEKHRTWG